MEFLKALILGLILFPVLVSAIIIVRNSRKKDEPDEDIPSQMVMESGIGFEAIHMYSCEERKTSCGYWYDEEADDFYRPSTGEVVKLVVTVDPSIVTCGNCKRVLDKEETDAQ